ncbi:MAG: zinc ribbon domain-containing protein [Thermodesulfobacteriota bacterium]
MPIYEYKCEECGKITEVFMKDRASEDSIFCSHCGSERIKKLISVPSVLRMGRFSSDSSTCCGREERCDTPPCSDGVCKRD